jgi:type II secretory pathway component PulF
MIYKYRAKKGPGELTEGTIEARSEKEAIEKIGQLGHLPLSIEEALTTARRESSFSNLFFGKIRSQDITIFSRQLASLLKAGVPILKALNIISEQSESLKLKGLLEKINNGIKDGASFSSVLTLHPYVFSSLYVAMIRAGEDSGNLPEVLFRLADYRRKQEELVSRFRMAMAYPILMAMVGTATIIFMLTFVMPRIMRIFVDMGQELPIPTQVLIAISRALSQGWYWIVVVFVIVVVLFRRQSQTTLGRLSLGIFKLHLPIFGNLILKLELSRFSRTLELLLKNGIPILKAIDIAIPVLENEAIKKELKKGYKELEQGNSFGRSLKNVKLFPVFMSNLIIVGEESGRLDDALSEIASAYERDTDEKIRVMSSLLEPVMILVLGLIVGFIVMAMLLPIFEINVMVR